MRIPVDGTTLEVLDEGPRSGAPPIVLLHGFPLSKAVWDTQAASLAARSRVVRVDLRGLGESGVPGGPYLLETLAGDLADVLDALRIERAFVVGHSLGGYVAYAFYRMFAERVAGLGIVQSRATADEPAIAQGRLALADRADAEGIEPVLAAFVPRMLAPQTVAAHPKLLARVHALAARTQPAGAAAMLRGMAARVGSEDLFTEFNVPVHVVAGIDDAFVPAELLREQAAAMRTGSFEALAGGHLPQWEAPDALTAAIERLRDRGVS